MVSLRREYIRSNSRAERMGKPLNHRSNVTTQVVSPPAVARLDCLWEVDLAACGCQIHLPHPDLRTAGGSEQARREPLSSYFKTYYRYLYCMYSDRKSASCTPLMVAALVCQKAATEAMSLQRSR